MEYRSAHSGGPQRRRAELCGAYRGWFRFLARLIDRATDEGHLALRARALAENTPSIAMLRRAGFVSRSGTGVLPEFELAFTRPAAP